MSKVKVAIVQHKAVHLDLQATIDKTIALIDEAADQGAQVTVFGETWLTGYPIWLDYCPDVALWNNPRAKAAFTRMVKNSVAIPGDETRLLGEKAKEKGVVLCMGVNERIASGPGNGTLYNSFIIIDASGEIVNHRRKLMPTYTERLLYGHGDGCDLNAVDTRFGRISGLICWEHWMPLARQALHESGEQIHVAVWPSVHEAHQIASRSYAFEGRCFVLAAGQMFQVKDIPDELWVPQHLSDDPDKWLLNGGSCVIGPDGMYIVEPVFGQETIMTAEIDLDACIGERMNLDVTGHYSRPDILKLTVNRDRK
ncbi:carbon-nitrogen hydrolase family protein [bacterium]|nr:carbon-nitrogen hydrolase family protein [bacterium]MBU1650960.1 carbon-nitrogen hydrolase family protein [bacterium]MBU1882214.1 carbon-nitrogen hydrolase family protein [bacterium]